MPYPPPRTPSGPRRRSLLASAAGAALLVGCSAGPDSGGGAAPSAAERARARAARDSAALLEHYDAVLAAHPALAQRLRPLRAQVAAHAKAFGGTGAAKSPSSTASPTSAAASSAASTAASAADSTAASTAASTASAPTVPADEKGALADLAAAERALADRRTTALLEVPGELARLMASVAAAGAAHAFVLTGEAK
ncbi:hypothetical protein ACFZCP_30395 [Streptomyces sp. NPDC007971]|uniref:hypothetical protein n=1 Tax=Streptomyces sp. NPDC007971 TaxID=3364799 RepID=UPI0036E72AA2